MGIVPEPRGRWLDFRHAQPPSAPSAQARIIAIRCGICGRADAWHMRSGCREQPDEKPA